MNLTRAKRNRRPYTYNPQQDSGHAQAFSVSLLHIRWHTTREHTHTHIHRHSAIHERDGC